MQDCRDYFATTGRRVSFEYLLAKGINDSDEQATALAQLLQGTGAHVNLIPLNHTPGSILEPSAHEQVKLFQNILEEKGITVTVRRRLGSDIDAACGQLRRAAMK
jgi:23S rRNA (adenine2503-C2)-methyltransferase